MDSSASIRIAACLFACTLLPTGAARAADDLYLGATLGFAAVTPDGLKTTRRQDGDGQASGGVFAGVRLATLAVGEGWPLDLELAYQNIARSTLRYEVEGANADLTASGHALSAAARLALPLTTRLGVYGKLGVARARVTGSTAPGQPVIEVAGRGTGAVSAIGIEYRYASGPALRGEVTRYSRVSPNAGAAAITLGFGFRFP